MNCPNCGTELRINHTTNVPICQALLAKKMGKTRIIAETGAGQHGVAAATAAALLNLECDVFMGEIDINRQHLNVERMKLLGAKVVPVTKGQHLIKWAYQKNGVTTSGEDAVWVDNIKLPVSGSQEIVVALEDMEEGNIRVYPNPAKDVIHIEGLEKNTTLEICDQVGRVVYIRKVSQQNEVIDISSLKTGVYYLIVRNSNAVSKNKILISK